MPELRKTTQSLQCILTPEEKLSYGEKMGSESQLYQESLDRKKEVSKQLAADVESHHAAIQRLGSLLANGYEYRSVDCEMVLDRDLGVVVVTRIDTGEVIEKRPIRPEEMQSSMEM